MYVYVKLQNILWYCSVDGKKNKAVQPAAVIFHPTATQPAYQLHSNINTNNTKQGTDKHHNV